MINKPILYILDIDKYTQVVYTLVEETIVKNAIVLNVSDVYPRKSGNVYFTKDAFKIYNFNRHISYIYNNTKYFDSSLHWTLFLIKEKALTSNLNKLDEKVNGI